MTTTQETQPYDLAQLVAYHEMRQSLEDDYFGRWVVIHNCELAGDYETYDEARARTRKEGFNLLDCLIQRVGVEPPIIVSYSS
ncbi:MAG: hypothetical protein OXU28_05260 [Chloroflexota bacterium]|nr:hypothetical protein [Chloroflexota bacterium]